MLLWRPVLAGMASITDIMNMSVGTLYDMHEALDIKEALEKEAHDAAKSQK